MVFYLGSWHRNIDQEMADETTKDHAGKLETEVHEEELYIQ
jgi:hypothetical protein